MKKVSRRGFLEKTLAIGAGSFIAPSLLNMQQAYSRNSTIAAAGSQWIGENNISLAQWALVDEINKGE